MEWETRYLVSCGVSPDLGEKHAAADISPRRFNESQLDGRELTFAATGSMTLPDGI